MGNYYVITIIITVLIILLVGLGVYLLYVYNSLIILSRDKDAARNDSEHDIQRLLKEIQNIDTTATKQKKITHITTTREQSTQYAEKVTIYNSLIQYLDENKLITTTIEKTQERSLLARRYYNHTTKQLNTRLCMFPSNIIGNIL